MPTLEEIAERSGFSRSTVSRVVNDDPHVSATTRTKIVDVIRKLDYQPNIAARSLAAGHTDILGLVIPTGVTALFVDPYFPLLIEGVAQACNAHDRSVMLWLAEPEYERRTIHKVLNNGLIDGVIVSSMVIDDPIIQALKASPLPFLLVGRHPNEEAVNYVDVNNRNSAREIVTHLLQLGYRRIATISGPRNMIAGIDRYQGYRDALQAYALQTKPALIAEGDFTEEGGAHNMRQLLLAQPEAVFVASDTMAIGALRALQEAGLCVPEDVALVGYDDIPAAAHTDPPLTTIRQPIKGMGITAVEMLIDCIRHPEREAQHTTLPTQLVIRKSCGAYLKSAGV